MRGKYARRRRASAQGNSAIEVAQESNTSDAEYFHSGVLFLGHAILTLAVVFCLMGFGLTLFGGELLMSDEVAGQLRWRLAGWAVACGVGMGFLEDLDKRSRNRAPE